MGHLRQQCPGDRRDTGPDIRQSVDQARIVLYILAGLVVVVLAVGTAILLRRSCRVRERWDDREVEKLDKDDIQQYETSDIIILHRSNGEEM